MESVLSPDIDFAATGFPKAQSPNTQSPKTQKWTAELYAHLQSAASRAGFDLVGVAGLGDLSELRDAERFAKWVAAGHAGEMSYLTRRDAGGELIRSAPQRSLPWARSAVVCGFSYRSQAPRSTDPAPQRTGWIARYAWSGRRNPEGQVQPTDYHDELLARLRQVEGELQAQTGCTTRPYVDTGPLLERGLAARAGIGWIGKNTCVLNQQLGSWLLLGVILTSLEPEPPADQDGREHRHPVLAPAKLATATQDRCGSCTRCIDACPTGALLASSDPGSARAMDAARCIAYLTIEKKGEIDPGLREGMGRQVFGCDICQDVCPWNARAARSGPIETRAGMEPRPELVNPALEWLAAMDSAQFRRAFKGSPLERTGRRRLHRNVALAMGNSGEQKFLPQLEEWASPELAESANGNERALADAARWAREKILGADHDL